MFDVLRCFQPHTSRLLLRFRPPCLEHCPALLALALEPITQELPRDWEIWAAFPRDHDHAEM